MKGVRFVPLCVLKLIDREDALLHIHPTLKGARTARVCHIFLGVSVTHHLQVGALLTARVQFSNVFESHAHWGRSISDRGLPEAG